MDHQGNDIPIPSLKNRDILVIDIEKLDDRGKRLIFGRVINEISKKLNSKSLEVDKVIIFVDELNKFAPSSNIKSPLKRKIIEITARGRSLGLVLFGAEQFASTVEKEVVENSSTFLYGRTESNELSSTNYGRFSNEIKSKISMLSQGQLLAKFAKFPQPIFIRFPHPPCPSGDKFEEE
jgi:DNA helicase HerA-like ATPase